MTDCTDVISCHVLNAVSSHRHWAKPAPLTHICPFTTKVMQSHLMAEIGTRSNLMTLPSGPRVDDSQSGEGVMIKKCTKTTIRTKTNNIIHLLWVQALFLLSSFWLHTPGWKRLKLKVLLLQSWSLVWDVVILKVEIELIVFSFLIKNNIFCQVEFGLGSNWHQDQQFSYWRHFWQKKELKRCVLF